MVYSACFRSARSFNLLNHVGRVTIVNQLCYCGVSGAVGIVHSVFETSRNNSNNYTRFCINLLMVSLSSETHSLVSNSIKSIVMRVQNKILFEKYLCVFSSTGRALLPGKNNASCHIQTKQFSKTEQTLYYKSKNGDTGACCHYPIGKIKTLSHAALHKGKNLLFQVCFISCKSVEFEHIPSSPIEKLACA